MTKPGRCVTWLSAKSFHMYQLPSPLKPPALSAGSMAIEPVGWGHAGTQTVGGGPAGRAVAVWSGQVALRWTKGGTARDMRGAMGEGDRCTVFPEYGYIPLHTVTYRYLPHRPP